MSQAGYQEFSSSQVKPGGKTHGFDWVYKLLDAAMTASLNAGGRKKDLAWSVISGRSSNYKRVSSFLNLLDGLLPGLAEKVTRALIGTKHIPLAGYKIRLLAYGTGATVFLLENGGDRKVLKVFRRSLGVSGRRALLVAKEFQEKHRLISSWFNGSHEVVVPSAFLVLHGPLLGITSAAVLQPYVDGKKVDLFQDFSEEEVVQLGQKDEGFREQLLDFSQQLFAAVDNRGLCFDLVGRENIMLVEHEEGIHLKIADNGVIDIPKIRDHSPELYTRLQAYLSRLHRITDRLKGVDYRGIS